MPIASDEPARANSAIMVSQTGFPSALRGRMAKVARIVVVLALGWALGGATAAPTPVIVLPLTGAIGPASEDFVERGLIRAEKDGAQLVVLQIDTPGGLDTSMREIVKSILASRVPVAAFVAPSGARAASAGTYILYASHVAAMAPGTNLGAATPVAIGAPSPMPAAPATPGKEPDAGKPEKASPGDDGGTMARKQTHDAAAYLRGLAQLRGRNVEWAERAVRESVSLSADEALAQHVVDLNARDIPELLAKLDGRRVMTAGGERELATAGAEAIVVAPDWKSRFLSVIANPSVALILMMIGIYGLFFEFSNPGFVLPGVVGAICAAARAFRAAPAAGELRRTRTDPAGPRLHDRRGVPAQLRRPRHRRHRRLRDRCGIADRYRRRGLRHPHWSDRRVGRRDRGVRLFRIGGRARRRAGVR